MTQDTPASAADQHWMELAIAVARQNPSAPFGALIISVLLLFMNWGSTAFLQVPCHTRLSRGFDRKVVRRLVRTNWIRTVAWSIRGVLAVTLFQVVP